MFPKSLLHDPEPPLPKHQTDKTHTKNIVNKTVPTNSKSSHITNQKIGRINYNKKQTNYSEEIDYMLNNESTKINKIKNSSTTAHTQTNSNTFSKLKTDQLNHSVKHLNRHQKDKKIEFIEQEIAKIHSLLSNLIKSSLCIDSYCNSNCNCFRPKSNCIEPKSNCTEP